MYLRQQAGNTQKPLIVAMVCTRLLLNLPTSKFRKQSSTKTSIDWTIASEILKHCKCNCRLT
jgi:hypothetical protein